MLTLSDHMTEGDLNAVLADVTPEDAAEMRAAGLQAVTASFVRGLRDSVIRGCVLRGDTPAAVFGCIADPNVESAGVPWMVATPQFRAHPRDAMVLSRLVIARMRGAFPYLHNWVHREHDVAIRWLSWLGFHVELQPVGPGGQFLHFEWSASNV